MQVTAERSGPTIFNELSKPAFKRLAANGYDPKALRTNRTLPRDAWKEIDDTIYSVARKRLVAIDALRQAGNGVVNELDGLHVLFDLWQTMSDMGDVEQSMDFRNQGPNDAPDFATNMIPIPLTHGDFNIGGRKMMAMEAAGNITIDKAMISQLTRKVSEKLEDTLFNGTDITLNGDSAPGLLNHPDVYDVTGDGDWTGSWESNPAEIYDDFKYLIKKAKETNYRGPYLVFAATDAYDATGIPDPEGSGDRDLRPRLEELGRIDEIIEVPRLDSGTVVFVDPVPEVIQLSTASDITATEWETQGGNVSNYKIFAALAPRVQSDDNGNTGIVKATDA